MTPMELTSRVTWESGGAVAVLSLVSGLVGGIPVAAGVGAGGVLAITNFRWLAGRVVSVLGGVPTLGGWALGFGLRLIALACATAGLMATGLVHPLGVVVGLTVLPGALVLRGLRQARAEHGGMGAIEHPPIFSLPGVPDYVTYTWLVMIILVVMSWAATRRMALVPAGVQNCMEVVLEQFNGMIDDVIGHDGRRYLPLIATLGLFILVANLLSLIPGLERPTGNLNTTAACALVVFFAYHYIGIKNQGLKNYARHFMGPVVWLAPLMVPIEIISHLARPLSLSLRLFGNMTGGHILLAIIFFLMGLDGLIGWALSGSLGGALVGGIGGLIMIAFTVGFLYPLKMLVSVLQAFIFVMLTMLYIAGALEHAEDHEGHADRHTEEYL